jgi:hypothetical protein
LENAMRSWAAELRIGLIAGLTGGLVVMAAPSVATFARTTLTTADPTQVAWTPPLVDPVQAATAALARGDSSFVAVALGESLRFPGLTQAVSDGASQERFRLYSSASTGLNGEGWEVFVTKAIPYAAAYNAVIQVARVTARSGL